MRKIPFSLLFILSLILAACAPQQPAPITVATQIVQTATATQPSLSTGTPAPAPIVESSLPTPGQALSSALIQDGPFTFDIRFHKDSAFSANPVAPSLYSDLEGIGLYFAWEYHGPALPPPVTISWGVDPIYLPMLSAFSETGLKDGNTGGRDGGLILPKGSQVGEHTEAVIKIEADGKAYGAIVEFSLKNGEKGLEPDNVQVIPLSTSKSQADTFVSGIIQDVALSARVIHLEKAAPDISTIALSDNARIYTKSGSEITLQQIRPGDHINAIGILGSAPGILIASQIALVNP